MNNITKDFKKLGCHHVAKITKEILTSIDNHPPLALHNYVKLNKNDIVGLLDEVPSNTIDYYTPSNARVYMNTGRFYLLTWIPYKNLKIIEDINGLKHQ
jgi:hypothetical protein